MLTLADANGIYIFAGSSDLMGFSPLKDLWYVNVASSSPSSFSVLTPKLSVAYAGKHNTFSVLATDFFHRNKDSLDCYDDLLLQITNDEDSVQGVVLFDFLSSRAFGGCVYQGSYLPVHSNLYHMSLKIDNNLVDGFPTVINVKTGAIDPDFSGLTFPSDIGACDGLATDKSTSFIIRTSDRNGNSGMSPSLISIEAYLLPDPFWNPLVDLNDDSLWTFSTSLQTNIVDSFNGFFQVTMSNTRSGNYSISVLLDGKPVSGSPFLCSIETANVDPTLMKVKALSNFTVGASSSFTMQTVDQFGNNISTAPGVAGDVVTAQLISADSSEAVVLEGDRGLWTVTVHPKVQGAAQLVVVVNDVVVVESTVHVKSLMQRVVYGSSWFAAIGSLPAIIVLVFACGSAFHYRGCLAKQAIANDEDLPPPDEPVVETFDDVRILLSRAACCASHTCMLRLTHVFRLTRFLLIRIG
jgi:hypothetical protein